MLYVLLTAAVVWGLATIYLAYRFRDFRKFLAGAFFVSWGMQLYLYFAKVSVPLLGTNFVFTPEISGARSIPHFISAVTVPASSCCLPLRGAASPRPCRSLSLRGCRPICNG